MHTMKARCASAYDSTCLDNELKRYDNRVKQSVEQKKTKCLAGASVIDVADSYNINDRMFRRDAVGAGLESQELSLVFCHSMNPGGCYPADLTRFTGFFLELLTHCQPVHHALLSDYERNKSPFLRNLLSSPVLVRWVAGRQAALRTLQHATRRRKKRWPIAIFHATVPGWWSHWFYS